MCRVRLHVCCVPQSSQDRLSLRDYSKTGIGQANQERCGLHDLCETGFECACVVYVACLDDRVLYVVCGLLRMRLHILTCVVVWNSLRFVLIPPFPTLSCRYFNK